MKIKTPITDYKLLITVLLLAAILRLWKLGSIPPHLTPDEAALGYNSYSILRTGRDEYGEFLPIIFKSFGDYKPGLYVYLTVPFIAIFGLTEFAVRLPSAIAGIVGVWLIYLIVNQLFRKQNKFSIFSPRGEAGNFKFSIGQIAALLLAISPWHIHFSRGAWEANVSLTLTLAGIYFFLKALEKQKYLVYSTAFFSLTLLTYQGAKLSTATVILILLLVFWQEFRGKFAPLSGKVLASIGIGIVISLPIILSIFQGKTGRLEVFSVFSYERPAEELYAFLDQGGERVGDLTYYLFHSESLNSARGILGRWFNHASGRFLFFEGDWQNPRHSAPNHGMLLLADLIFLIVGFVGLVRAKGKAPLFIFLWLVFAPLPAALSRDQVHAVRALNMVIPLVILGSIGASKILKHFLKVLKVRGSGTKQPVGLNRFKPVTFWAIVGLGIGYLASFIYFSDAYFVHLPKHDAKHWFYGYKQAVKVITPIQEDYEKIIFQQSYSQPYIYFLFYQKYPPEIYQKQARLTEGGLDVGLVEKLDNISFEFFSWPVHLDERTLIVGDSVVISDDFSKEDYTSVSEVKYPDGFETAFRILEMK